MPTSNHSQTTPFISCGMYAFTTELQNAWQALFNEFYSLDDSSAFGLPSNLDPALIFDSTPQLMQDEKLYLAHTCGYPWMKFYKDSHDPVCVPVFDVEGAIAKQYSSRIVVRKESSISSIAESKGLVAAINGEDSNSGMNVFRYAICDLANGENFFSSVIVSGGHWQSMIEVTEGRADVAAIDCVTFAILEKTQSSLCDQLQTIQWSTPTTGLPFVIPKDSLDSSQKLEMIKALNISLDKLKDHHRDILQLNCFAAVEQPDYEPIMALETHAIQQNYASVR